MIASCLLLLMLYCFFRRYSFGMRNLNHYVYGKTLRAQFFFKGPTTSCCYSRKTFKKTLFPRFHGKYKIVEHQALNDRASRQELGLWLLRWLSSTELGRPFRVPELLEVWNHKRNRQTRRCQGVVSNLETRERKLVELETWFSVWIGESGHWNFNLEASLTPGGTPRSTQYFSF